MSVPVRRSGGRRPRWGGGEGGGRAGGLGAGRGPGRPLSTPFPRLARRQPRPGRAETPARWEGAARPAGLARRFRRCGPGGGPGPSWAPSIGRYGGGGRTPHLGWGRESRTPAFPGGAPDPPPQEPRSGPRYCSPHPSAWGREFRRPIFKRGIQGFPPSPRTPVIVPLTLQSWGPEFWKPLPQEVIQSSTCPPGTQRRIPVISPPSVQLRDGNSGANLRVPLPPGNPGGDSALSPDPPSWNLRR